MNYDISAILFGERELQARIQEIGTELSKIYADKNPILICILRGAIVFLADLMRYITIPIEIDFMRISSYGASVKSAGVITIKKEIATEIKGRHIIIVEDIVDTGLSLQFLIEHFQKFNPESIATCVLLKKSQTQLTELKIDYLAFTVENEFVVGYGLDFNEKYRNLPYIGILKEEVYK